VGNVNCLSFAGVKCWFYSLDHRPPHFHAKRKGKWHIRVYFMRAKTRMIEHVPGSKGRIRGKERRELLRVAELCREELLQEWEQKVHPDV